MIFIWIPFCDGLESDTIHVKVVFDKSLAMNPSCPAAVVFGWQLIGSLSNLSSDEIDLPLLMLLKASAEALFWSSVLYHGYFEITRQNYSKTTFCAISTDLRFVFHAFYVRWWTLHFRLNRAQLCGHNSLQIQIQVCSPGPWWIQSSVKV